MGTDQAATVVTSLSWLPNAMMAMIGWLVVWGAWVSLQTTSKLSRAEHAEICDKKDKEMNYRLDKMDAVIIQRFDAIGKVLDKQDSVATESRHAMNNKLQEIVLNVALMNNRQQQQVSQIPQIPQLPQTQNRNT